MLSSSSLPVGAPPLFVFFDSQAGIEPASPVAFPAHFPLFIVIKKTYPARKRQKTYAAQKVCSILRRERKNGITECHHIEGLIHYYKEESR